MDYYAIGLLLISFFFAFHAILIYLLADYAVYICCFRFSDADFHFSSSGLR